MNWLTFLAHPYVIVVARWVLSAVFLIAGIAKLFDRTGFVQAVQAYEILPPRFSRVVGLSLPWVEVAIGFALLVGLWTRPAAIAAVALFMCFIVAIAVNLMRGKDLDCHCFGQVHQEKISATTLLRNLALILPAAQVLIFADDYLAVDGWLFGENTNVTLPIADLIPIILTIVAVFIVYLLIQQIWAMTHPKES